MGYGMTKKYPTNRRYLTLFRSEKRRGALDTYTCPPREPGRTFGFTRWGNSISDRGGPLFLFVYPPTWYLVKRRDEKRDARDTRYEIVTLFGPDV